MGIFNKVGETINTTADMAKNMSETGNIKRRLQYEEERIEEIFSDIGRKYFEDPVAHKVEIDGMCDDIKTRKRRISRIKLELNQIKGIKICEKCGAQVDEKYTFCGVCGAKLPDYNDLLNDEKDMSSSELSKYFNLEKAST